MTASYLDEHSKNKLLRTVNNTGAEFKERKASSTNALPTLAKAPKTVNAMASAEFVLQKNKPGGLSSGDGTRTAFAMCNLKKDDVVLLQRCVGEDSNGFWVATKCSNSVAPIDTACVCEVLDALDTANGGPLSTATVDGLRVSCGCEATTVPSATCDGLTFPQQITATFSGFSDFTDSTRGFTTKARLSELNGQKATWFDVLPSGLGCEFRLANQPEFFIENLSFPGFGTTRKLVNSSIFYNGTTEVWGVSVAFDPGPVTMIDLQNGNQNGGTFGPTYAHYKQDPGAVINPLFYGSIDVEPFRDLLGNAATGIITFN